jgi:hypothetical protein
MDNSYHITPAIQAWGTRPNWRAVTSYDETCRPNSVGVYFPSSDGGNLSSFQTLCFLFIYNFRWWTKSRNSVILSVMHNCQNPLDSNHGKWLYYLSLSIAEVRGAKFGTSLRISPIQKRPCGHFILLSSEGFNFQTISVITVFCRNTQNFHMLVNN